MRRRTIPLLMAMAAALVLASGVALAKSIRCPTKQGTHKCIGTNNADTITGTNRADIIKARGGDDTVTARSGKDKVYGEDGADQLDGGPGNDTLDGGPNATNTLEGIVGGTGDDTLVESAGPDRYVFGPGWEHDQITGDTSLESANDDVCFACGPNAMSTSVTIDLGVGTATDGTNTVSWNAPIIENATGGFGADTITGGSVANVIDGSSGADTINVSGDPSGASDFVSCGSGPSGDGATDTVTKDPNDDLGTNCGSDTVIVVP